MALDPEADRQEMIVYDLDSGRSATLKLKDAEEKLSALLPAIRNVIYHWQRFEEPSHDERKRLYDAFTKAGGKTA